ncbi:MAG TPA: GNAT family N-acetyltransferase [Acidimicrobiales bacterium]|nr:GNAT family N-acetyltransferase [Acidimicrobiales bacterium]
MPRHRLGVALLVPRPAATEVDGLRRALGDGARLRIPAHVTLVPPVNVPEDRLADALAVLRESAGRTGPLRLRFGPAATFHPVTPVVYLQVGGDIAGVHALRDAVFRPPLERPLTHGFSPHLTVADDMAPERIPAAVAALADFAVDVTIDRVHLLREEAGRLWHPLADAALARPAVLARGGLPLELSVSDRVPPDAEALATAAPTGGFAVTARRSGELVGLATGAITGDSGRLDRLVVAGGARREGIGRHLLAAVEDLARTRACSLLHTRAPDDPAATALLAGAGWHPTDPPERRLDPLSRSPLPASTSPPPPRPASPLVQSSPPSATGRAAPGVPEASDAGPARHRGWERRVPE